MVPRLNETVEDAVIDAYRDGRTVNSICDEFHITRPTLYNVLRRYNVPTRGNPGAGQKPFTEEELERITELRTLNWSKEEICDDLHTSITRLNRALEFLGLSDRMRRRDAKPFVKLNTGYICVLPNKDDPVHGMKHGKSGYVLEHRLVMARHLGRALTDDETVHHINGDRADNRLENLQLRSGRHGKHAAFVCVDCGSQNVVPTTLL
jgi:transposase-like protein